MTVRARDALAKRLRDLRIAAGISQEELGARADLDRTFVSRAEAGAQNLSVDSIEKFAKALGVSVADLLQESSQAGVMEAQQEGVVQDAVREEQLRALFGLSPSGQGRMGADAVDKQGNEFELKSTTKRSVTTARDVGPHTLTKWSGRYWLIARGRQLADRRFEILGVYFLSPRMMDPWIRGLRARFRKDLDLLGRAEVELGRSSAFDVAEVRRLRYLVERGLTLNNPKIPWAYVEQRGVRVDQDYARELRRLVRMHPLRPRR